jgi:hypothetical protein
MAESSATSLFGAWFAKAAAREHALRGGFPANRISEVKSMIDPTTGGK